MPNEGRDGDRAPQRGGAPNRGGEAKGGNALEARLRAHYEAMPVPSGGRERALAALRAASLAPEAAPAHAPAPARRGVIVQLWQVSQFAVAAGLLVAVGVGVAGWPDAPRGVDPIPADAIAAPATEPEAPVAPDGTTVEVQLAAEPSPPAAPANDDPDAERHAREMQEAIDRAAPGLSSPVLPASRDD